MPAIALETNATIVAMRLQDLESEIPKVGRLQMYRNMQRIQKRMRTPGRKPTYPINWVSKKQMRAFYATEGFGRGIPTKRTNEGVKSWQIIKLENGYGLGSPLPWIKHVRGGPFGGSQSRIHQDRWELLRVAFVDETEKLPAEVSEQIRIVAKTKGFA